MTINREEIEDTSTETLKEELEEIIYHKIKYCSEPFQVRNALRILYELITRHD